MRGHGGLACALGPVEQDRGQLPGAFESDISHFFEYSHDVGVSLTVIDQRISDIDVEGSLIDTKPWLDFLKGIQKIALSNFGSSLNLELLAEVHYIVAFRHRVRRSVLDYCLQLSSRVVLGQIRDL